MFHSLKRELYATWNIILRPSVNIEMLGLYGAKLLGIQHVWGFRYALLYNKELIVVQMIFINP